MTSKNESARRLIEEWLPINELSVDAIREGGALAGHPPVNQLHVWWARRPLVVSRASRWLRPYLARVPTTKPSSLLWVPAVKLWIRASPNGCAEG